jgi:hypothetical protein
LSTLLLKDTTPLPPPTHIKSVTRLFTSSLADLRLVLMEETDTLEDVVAPTNEEAAADSKITVDHPVDEEDLDRTAAVEVLLVPSEVVDHLSPPMHEQN